MAMPKAYSPEHGCKFQILVMSPNEREWEHLDYADSGKQKEHLLKNYKLVYKDGFRFKTILLPAKYWPKFI